MGFYGRLIVPRLIAVVMRTPKLAPFRARVGAAASGRVLELGIGPGLNLAFYPPAVTSVVGIDPSPLLLGIAKQHGDGRAFPLTLHAAPAENLPIDSASIDTVVTTWTLCSVSDIAAALTEARRVLRPGGRLLFAEHGLAPDASVARWQHRINPAWRALAGGCHVDRAIDMAIAQAGFRLDRLETGYLGFPRALTYMYSGSAVRH